MSNTRSPSSSPAAATPTRNSPSPAEPIVGTVIQAACGVLGRSVDVVGVSYWADSAFLQAAGIPTVLFGPDGDGAHAAVEWVSLPGTIACTQTLTAAAQAFCR